MPEGKHRAKGYYGFQGTPSYGSINTLRGYNSSRRDDLEGLGYSLMALLDKNQVPWSKIEDKK
jgi:hypothetical protein